MVNQPIKIAQPDPPPRVERRRFFRLRFPPQDCGEIWIGLRVHRLTEISEEGVRFTFATAGAYRLGQTVVATLILHEQRQVTVSGVVYRLEPMEVILRLTRERISEHIVINEQRYMIKTHPQFTRRAR